MCSTQKVFFKTSQNSQENICVRVSFLEKLQAVAWNVFKKVTLGQLFSCEYCEIFKNTLLYRAPLVAAPEQHKHHKYWSRTHSFLLLLFLTLNCFASWGINSIYSRWRFPFTCFSFQFSLCLVQFIDVSIAR